MSSADPQATNGVLTPDLPGIMSALPTERTSIGVVIPAYNARATIVQCVESVLRAGAQWGPVAVTLVDNGSNDGTPEIVRHRFGNQVKILSIPEVSVGQLRNLGARETPGSLISFVDADCVISENYFFQAVDVLAHSGAAATGSAYRLPAQPGWIEKAWHRLHDQSNPRDVAFLNAGNFIVRREVFEQVGGFDERLLTGEDAELGARITRNGFRIRAEPSVAAEHLGNPKSLTAFCRQQWWHGLGALGTARHNWLDKPLLMTVTHAILTIAGLFVIVLESLSTWKGVAVILASQVLVPAATLAYRSVTARRLRATLPGFLLYWLYYWSRVLALSTALIGVPPPGRGRR